MQRNEEEFWKRKLAAYLHDPACKALDFGPTHERCAESFLRAALAGIDEEELKRLRSGVKSADHMAAAADRCTFPKSGTTTPFEGENARFAHPLGGGQHQFVPGEMPPSFEEAERILQNAVGGIETADLRLRFMLYWRRWREECAGQESRGAVSLASLPAETRLPDHTIWNHNAVASALEGCRNEGGEIDPAFLIFQLGPVQDFIAAARSVRDLWSGSYLLSWLTASAIKAVTDRMGPDAVIFPALCGQGIFDALHREDFEMLAYTGPNGRKDTLWFRLYGGERAEAKAESLCKPTLPNRFLALVPCAEAETLANAAENAVHAELAAIGESCWALVETLAREAGCAEATVSSWKVRWDSQLALHPEVTWQTLPWIRDVDEALEALEALPQVENEQKWTTSKVLRAYHGMAKETYPDLVNAGFLWSANVMRAEYHLAARRNTRSFEAFVTDDDQAGTPKDALTGREELVGDEAFWDWLTDEDEQKYFKDNDGPYGAMTLVKRLWCRTESKCLQDKLGIDEEAFRKAVRFESVPDIAGSDEENGYVAVIALDGDNMGQWVAGTRAPAFLEQLSRPARGYFEELLAKHKVDSSLPRALIPSYHAQFSEALSNYAVHVVPAIIHRFKGQLVYAGGDDVLAIVPVHGAVDCARALRAGFRGKSVELPDDISEYRIAEMRDGFVSGLTPRLLTVPGPRTEASCGVAVAHVKYPLQAMVREARAAESRAKHDYGKGALAVSLIKRGGERIEWGCKWTGAALRLLAAYMRNVETGRVEAAADKARPSGRFPYALAGLLAPYDFEAARKSGLEPGFDARSVIEKELRHVIERQGGKLLREQALAYLDELAVTGAWEDFAKLFLTGAFLRRLS